MRNFSKDLEKAEKRKRKKHKKKLGIRRILLGTGVVLGVFFLTVAATFFVLRAIGKSQFRDSQVGSVADMRMDKKGTGQEETPRTDGKLKGAEADDSEGSDETLQKEKEGRVYYKGKTYDFNKDILTFLVMGIDQKNETVQEVSDAEDGGSADAIFLLVLNPHTKKMQILAIDRNTMTDVDIYDDYGAYKSTVQTQICVQHAYGGGTERSAEYMGKAVSNLMYGLPINGYCAINMSAIPKINDAVGGVEVQVLEDVTPMDKRLVKGETVLLEGRTAFWYVKYRDTNVFASSTGRLERQKQYISAYVKKAKAQCKEDASLPVTLYQTLKAYMTTDLTLEKVTYLAGMAAGFDFGGTDIQKIAGETVQGDKFEEFYVDEDALYELILDVFYEEVDE